MTYSEFEKEYLHNKVVDFKYYDYKDLTKIYDTEVICGEPKDFYSENGEPLYLSIINESEALTLNNLTYEFVTFIPDLDLYFWFQYYPTICDIDLK